MIYPLKRVIFHCYFSFTRGIQRVYAKELKHMELEYVKLHGILGLVTPNTDNGFAIVVDCTYLPVGCYKLMVANAVCAED